MGDDYFDGRWVRFREHVRSVDGEIGAVGFAVYRTPGSRGYPMRRTPGDGMEKTKESAAETVTLVERHSPTRPVVPGDASVDGLRR